MTPSEELTPSTAPLVFIEWEDIQAHEDWNDDSEENSTCTLKSVGWLIEDSPRKLVIAATYDYENEKWANKFAIPKLPPTVMTLRVVEDEAPQMNFRHVPRPIDDEDRHAPNQNKVDAFWHATSLIPGQP
jgi:hypothetical protein